MIYVVATIQACLAAVLFTYGYVSQVTPKKVEKPDCIAEVIKTIDKAGQVKSACDKLCQADQPQPRPRYRYYDQDCGCWRYG